MFFLTHSILGENIAFEVRWRTLKMCCMCVLNIYTSTTKHIFHSFFFLLPSNPNTGTGKIQYAMSQAPNCNISTYGLWIQVVNIFLFLCFRIRVMPRIQILDTSPLELLKIGVHCFFCLWWADKHLPSNQTYLSLFFLSIGLKPKHWDQEYTIPHDSSA